MANRFLSHILSSADVPRATRVAGLWPLPPPKGTAVPSFSHLHSTEGRTAPASSYQHPCKETKVRAAP